MLLIVKRDLLILERFSSIDNMLVLSEEPTLTRACTSTLFSLLDRVSDSVFNYLVDMLLQTYVYSIFSLHSRLTLLSQRSLNFLIGARLAIIRDRLGSVGGGDCGRLGGGRCCSHLVVLLMLFRIIADFLLAAHIVVR